MFTAIALNLANVLVFDNGLTKIADFGLAKKAGETESKIEVRGTPMYIASESVNGNEYEALSDVWALECLVAEMASGKPVWDHNSGGNMFRLLMRIGGDESSEIPEDLCEENKDFVSKCSMKDPAKRWTAEVLLSHLFVSKDKEERKKELISSSPRCHFELSDSVSMAS